MPYLLDVLSIKFPFMDGIYIFQVYENLINLIQCTSIDEQGFLICPSGHCDVKIVVTLELDGISNYWSINDTECGLYSTISSK